MMTTLVCLFTVFFLTANQFQSSVGQFCDVDAHCGPGECCGAMRIVQPGKREENTTLPMGELNGTALDLAPPRGDGWCRPFSGENEPCACGCAQGLTCVSSPLPDSIIDPGFVIRPPPPVCRRSCASDDDCCNDGCCEMRSSLRGPFQQGWCRPLAQEGEGCTCRRCAPGLVCSGSISGDLNFDGGLLASLAQGVCKRPKPRFCNFDGECGKRQCCYIPFLLKKRFAPFPTWGTCEDFRGLGEPCSGPCGCNPGLICSSEVSTWRLDSIINSTFIASLPEICVKPVITIS